jgi:hypothetical protein
MTAEAQSPETRFDANMAALRRHYPIVWLRLGEITTPRSQITGSTESLDVNLDLGHTLLYAPDAVTYAETQVARFRASPSRFYMNPPPRHDRPYQHQHFIANALYDYAKTRPVAATPTAPVDTGGFLLVYGIGLGFHLPALFDEAKVRNFILIEEHLEFLHQSLHLHDWAGIFETLVERGQTLRFVFGPEPRNVAAQVHWYMRGQGFGLIDGSYIFRHYSSMMLDKAYDEFAESISLLPISIGFFEDERQMLTNCGANLIWYGFHLLEEKKRVEIDLPALIIGSGPSLDKSIEIIRALQDKAVLFSCGSSLRPLLKAGIRPDFHCELENTDTAFFSVRNAVKDLGTDLDGITLIASTTVYSHMLELFKERILYFRDSVSSTGLWSPDQSGVFGTAPTCTNLAMRAAALLCFKELYLFGVDMGTRDPSQHHSKDSVYYADKRWHGVLEAEPPNQMKIELPGNFGGKAYTSQILHWARMMMGQGIEAFSFSKIYNCSDGVAIPGTTPRLPGSIRTNVAPGRKPIILARILRDLDPKSPREMVPLDQLQGARAGFRDYYDQLLRTIDEALEQQWSFIEFYDATAIYLREKGDSPFQTTLRSVNIGMIMMGFQTAYYFVRRVPVAEEPAVMAVYLATFRNGLVEMRASIDVLLGWLIWLHGTERGEYTLERDAYLGWNEDRTAQPSS